MLPPLPPPADARRRQVTCGKCLCSVRKLPNNDRNRTCPFRFYLGWLTFHGRSNLREELGVMTLPWSSKLEPLEDALMLHNDGHILCTVALALAEVLSALPPALALTIFRNVS